MCNLVKSSRIHLKYLCEKNLQKIEIHMDPCTEQRATDNLISVIKSKKEKHLQDFMMAFINRTETSQETQAMGHLLHLLSGGAAMSSLVPFKFHKKILHTCGAIRNDVHVPENLHEIKQILVLRFHMHCKCVNCMDLEMNASLL